MFFSLNCHASGARVLRLNMKFILPLPFCKASSAGAETCSTKPGYEFPAAGELRLMAYVLSTDLVYLDQDV